MKKLIIIGASGHGKVIADIAVKNDYDNIFFLDDNEEIKECAGFPVIGRTNDAKKMAGDKIVAIGNAKIKVFFLIIRVKTMKKKRKYMKV